MDYTQKDSIKWKEENWQFRKDYEFYLVDEWKMDYFAYDYFKSHYKNCKNKEKYDLWSYDKKLYIDVLRVHTMICKQTIKLYEQLKLLEKTIFYHANSLSENDLLYSLRSLYEKTGQIKNFYDLNFYCIVKVGKKFDKLIKLIMSKRQTVENDSNPNESIIQLILGKIGKLLPHKLSRRSISRVVLSPSLLMQNDLICDESNIFQLSDDSSWANFSSGEFIYQDFVRHERIIHWLKKEVVAVYSGEFRKNYSEIGEKELRYVKTHDFADVNAKFSIGLKCGCIMSMVSEILILI